MSFIGRKVLCIVLVLLLTGGCSILRTPQSLPQEQRDSLGRLAVASVHCAPQIQIDITHGRGHGAAKAAGAGALSSVEGGLQTGDAIGLLFGIALAPVFATGGAVYGALANESTKAVDEHTKAFEDYLLGTELQEFLKQVVVDQISLRVEQKISRVDLIGPNGFEQVKDYRGEHDIDTVLEVGFKEISLSDQSVSNAQIVLQADALTRLVKVEDAEIVFEREYHYQSAGRTLDDWSADNGDLLKREFQTVTHQFAERIVDDYFITSAKFTSWLVSLEATQPEIDRCFFCKDHIRPLDTCQPELCWRGFPAPEDLAKPDMAWLQHAEDTVYDLKIRKYPNGAALEIADLEQSCFLFEVPLEPCQLYEWAVRARFWIDGTEHATPWQRNGRNDFKTACKGK